MVNAVIMLFSVLHNQLIINSILISNYFQNIIQKYIMRKPQAQFTEKKTLRNLIMA